MNHIELTIQDLTAARNRVDLVIESLRQFQAGAYEMPVAISAPSAPALSAPALPDHMTSVPPATLKEAAKPRVVRRAKTRVPHETVKQGKRHKHPRQPNDSTARLLAAARQLAEPIMVDDLVKATRLKRKQCENFLVQRVVSKVFARAGRGQYRRGVNFPQMEKTNGAEPTKPRLNIVSEQSASWTQRASSAPAVVPISVAQGLGDKATTVGGAMKQVIRTIAEFTGAQLRDALRKDADYEKLLDQSPTAFCGNLIYWSNQGYLERDGDGALEALFKVTSKGREWFAK